MVYQHLANWQRLANGLFCIYGLSPQIFLQFLFNTNSCQENMHNTGCCNKEEQSCCTLSLFHVYAKCCSSSHTLFLHGNTLDTGIYDQCMTSPIIRIHTIVYTSKFESVGKALSTQLDMLVVVRFIIAAHSERLQKTESED